MCESKHEMSYIRGLALHTFRGQWYIGGFSCPMTDYTEKAIRVKYYRTEHDHLMSYNKTAHIDYIFYDPKIKSSESGLITFEHFICSDHERTP